MTIEEIIHHLEPGATISIANEPFSYAGKAHITLEGGDLRYWLFDNEGNILSISPDDEEIIHFLQVDEDLEPQSGMIFFRNKEYEFNYEDSGSVSSILGELDIEEDDQTVFADYESDNGQIVRIVTNQNSGEKYFYHGSTVVEEDILPVD